MPASPRSVYIHVPFCGRRCGYCNFALVTGRDDLIGGYLDALEREIEETCTASGGRIEVDTIYLGGGTPTYLRGADLERLFAIIARFFDLRVGGEFTVEANPLDCEPAQMGVLKRAGVGRISLGGQSFDAKKLVVLERDHTPDQLHQALEVVCQHFDNVSLDLIFASPGESLRQWKADLAIGLEYPVSHLSTYGLTIERGAAFYGRSLRGQVVEVEEDVQTEMYLATIHQLCQHGFHHYEVSSFARPQCRSQHNQVYWSGRPWYGFGPGAASYVESDEASAGLPMMERRVNHRSTTTYIRKLLGGESARCERDLVWPEQQLRERLVFGLRQLDGVDLEQLSRWWGGPVEPVFAPYLDRYVASGWLERDHRGLRLSTSGLLISDSLWPDLLA